jgi:hypothetical protein
VQRQNVQYERMINKHRFYRNASIWCYTHNRFECIIAWVNHNDPNEFYAIIDTITPKILTKKIGNIEFTILLQEGLICPDTNLPKTMKYILSSIMYKLLEKEHIYKIPDYI